MMPTSIYMVGRFMMQSYPPRALDRRLQEDWAKDAREGPRVLMSLRSTKFRALLFLSLHLSPSSSKLLSVASYGEAKESIDEEDPRPTSSNGAYIIVNGEGSTPKDPLYKILDELRSLKLWKEKQERKEKVEEISQDEREKIREKERRKILKELKKEKHASYSSHNSCKSLSEELRDYYEGRHRAHPRPHSHWREKERKPQEANINLLYFHGKHNVEANLDWEIRVEQQLKRKSTSKSFGSHSYPKKDQGQGILGVTPSKPKDDEGKTIEKQPVKASMKEKTSSINSQDEATTSPSSSESEEAKGEESSKEIYPQEEGQPLMVKEECKEVSVSSKRLAKKERHFEIKTNIKKISPLRQPPHFLLCKKTLVSIATPLRLEFIPQVKELLDEGLLQELKSLCFVGGMMNVLSGEALFCKITHAPNIFMICVHRDSLGRFVLIFCFNANLAAHVGHLRFVGEGMMQSYPPRALDRRLQEDWAKDAREGPRTHLLLEVASPLSLPFFIPLLVIFQEAKESIDEEDPRPTSSNEVYISLGADGCCFLDLWDRSCWIKWPRNN
ncbi:hypothetical protein HKD37_14G040615 [Glycine soja]